MIQVLKRSKVPRVVGLEFQRTVLVPLPKTKDVMSLWRCRMHKAFTWWMFVDGGKMKETGRTCSEKYVRISNQEMRET